MKALLTLMLGLFDAGRIPAQVAAAHRAAPADGRGTTCFGCVPPHVMVTALPMGTCGCGHKGQLVSWKLVTR